MKLLLTLFFLLTQINNTLAQDSLKVTEINKTFSKGTQNGYCIKIPQTKIKNAISYWKKIINQKNKISVKEIDGEYILDKTKIPEISSDSIIIYSIFIENPTYVEIVSFVSGNDTDFYSTASNPNISSNFIIFIHKYAVSLYKNAVTTELSAEQKKLITLEENLKDIENENVQYGKKIKANERTNERIQEEIKSNLQLQELKSESILQQQKSIASYSNPSDQKSDEEKKLKAIQKEKKKLEKNNESLHSDIEDNENDNLNLQKTIDKNISEIIPAKQEEIKKQRELIAIVEKKLKGIQ